MPSIEVEYAKQIMVGFDNGYLIVVAFSSNELEQLLAESRLTAVRQPIDAAAAPDLLAQNSPEIAARTIWRIQDVVVVDSSSRYRDTYIACSPSDCRAYFNVYET